jgi:hypothetical protein
MKFGIVDKENNLIPPLILDKEVAKLWGVTQSKKNFVKPDTELVDISWYNLIGFAITYPSYDKNINWKNVKISIFIYIGADIILDPVEIQLQRICDINIFLKPYFDVIDYFESKGYKPIKLED